MHFYEILYLLFHILDYQLIYRGVNGLYNFRKTLKAGLAAKLKMLSPKQTT